MTREKTVSQLIDALTTANKLMGRCFHDQFSMQDMSLGQLKLLLVLDGSKLTAGELANRLFMTPSALTQAVEPLVQDGFVLRTNDPADRRLVHLMLSKQGVKKLEQVTAMRREMLTKIVEPLSTKELETMVAIQTKLVDALKKCIKD